MIKKIDLKEFDEFSHVVGACVKKINEIIDEVNLINNPKKSLADELGGY